MVARDALGQAARDCHYLLDRGYSAKPSLVLVGDHWRLSAEERLILFRGIASTGDSERRLARLIPSEKAESLRGGLLLIDAYNAAFVLIHYLIGKACFISSDGLLRDAGANYGRLAHDELLGRAFGELAVACRGLGPARVEAFLDSPISRSAEHAEALRAAFDAAEVPASVELARSADGAILARLSGLAETEPAPTVVASGDSVLANSSPLIFDLARYVLETRFGAEIFDLRRLLVGSVTKLCDSQVGPCP